MTITGFADLTLSVKDVEAAIGAYERVFAFPASGAADADGTAEFKLANASFKLIGAGRNGPASESRAEGLSSIGFAVADLDRARRRLERLSVPVGEIGAMTSATSRSFALSTPGAFSTTFSDGETADTLASAGLADRAAIRGLDIVVLSTSDPIAAMAHYGARLGLPLVFDRAMPGGSRLQQFAVGTELLEVVHKASRNANKTKAPAKKKPTASRARDDKRLQLLTYMRPDLVKDLKIEALNNDVNAYEVVEHAVEAWLALPARSYKP